jgi:hypothetical protein
VNETINPFEIACDKATATQSSAVSKRIELGTLCLADSVARLHLPISKLHGASISLEMGFESGFGYDEPSKQFTSVVKIHCKGKVGEPNGTLIEKDAEVFTVTATYVLEMLLVQDFETPEERNTHLASFSAMNAPMAVWPCWRDFLQSATGRMGLIPVTAPFLRVDVKAETPAKQE